MSISRGGVQHVARLGRLELTEEEIDLDVLPIACPMDVTNAMRASPVPT